MGVVVEVEPVEPDNSFGAIASELQGGALKEKEREKEKEKDERKKVRLCRDCLNVVLCVLFPPSSRGNESGKELNKGGER